MVCFKYIANVGFCCLALMLSACNSSSSGGNASGGAQQGSGSVFLLNEVTWGRLVTVLDENGEVVQENKVIEPNFLGDSHSTLSVNSLTDQEALSIDFAQNSAGFSQVFDSLDDELPTLTLKSRGGFSGQGQLPPFTPISRNAAIKLTFNNPIAADSINDFSVSILAGVPPATPVSLRKVVDSAEPRSLVLDPTISSFDANQTALPANLTGLPRGISDIYFNLELGIPVVTDTANNLSGILRDSAGNGLEPTSNQPVEAGHISAVFRSAMDSDAVGEFLADNITPKIVARRLITISGVSELGSKTRITYSFDTFADADCSLIPGVGDVYIQGSAFGLIASNGDLQDTAAPTFSVDVALLQGSITTGSATTQHIYNDANDADLKPCFLQYSSDPLTLDLSSSPQAIGVNADTQFTLNFSKPIKTETLLANEHVLLGNEDLDPTELPDDVSGSGNYFGLNTSSAGKSSLAPIRVVPSADNKSISLIPLLPLRNDDSNVGSVCTSPDSAVFADNCFYLHLLLDRVTDLAGNSLPAAANSAGAGGANDFEISQIFPTNPTVAGSTFTSGGIALRFNTPGLEEDGNLGNSVIAGQILTSNGQLLSRPVQRFSAAFQKDLPLEQNPRETIETMLTSVQTTTLAKINHMVPVAAPFKNGGSRLQTLYRYFDLGLSMGDGSTIDGCVDDVAEFNLDVEGLAFSPASPTIVPDRFENVELRLSHSNYSPDETQFFDILSIFDPQGVGIMDDILFDNPSEAGCFQFSGLLGNNQVNSSFNSNIFELQRGVQGNGLGQKTVYSGPFDISEAQLIAATSGNAIKLVPIPDFTSTFTWRDTRLVVQDPAHPLANNNLGEPLLGGANSNGVDPTRFCEIGSSFSEQNNRDDILVAGCENRAVFSSLVPPLGAPKPIGSADGCFTTPDEIDNWINPMGKSRNKIRDLGWPPAVDRDPCIASIGLPLLIEFRVQPDAIANGLNTFKTVGANRANGGVVSQIVGTGDDSLIFAIPVVNTDATLTQGHFYLSNQNVDLNFYPFHPWSRIQSSGLNLSGGGATIFPDTELNARGEFVSAPLFPDEPTSPSYTGFTDRGDDQYYIGQVDFVTKTSVAFTRWFDTGSTSTVFTGVVQEPSSEILKPFGVSIEIAYRGGTAQPTGANNVLDAKQLDPYGNNPDTALDDSDECRSGSYTPTTAWADDITDLNGQGIRAVQVRFVFHGNIDANLTAWLEGFQIGWEE